MHDAVASMSKVTSTGACRAAPAEGRRDRTAEQLVVGGHLALRTCETRIVTALWPSSAVENTWLFLVGIVVLRSIMRVNTPPSARCRAKRRHVEQQHVLDVAFQHAALDGRTAANLVGLRPFGAPCQTAPSQLLHFRHARHAADQHPLRRIGRLEAASLIACWQGPWSSR